MQSLRPAAEAVLCSFLPRVGSGRTRTALVEVSSAAGEGIEGVCAGSAAGLLESFGPAGSVGVSVGAYGARSGFDALA